MRISLNKKKFIFLSFLIILSIIFYNKFKLKTQISTKKIIESNNDETKMSNIIKDIKYSSKDIKGNEYIILAEEGEIDFNNSDIIYLTNVNATIKLIRNNQIIDIKSNFGKYNTVSFDTIFSKNVKINYLDNIIKGNYLDFSMNNNLLIISKNVTYSNSENILYADVIKMDTISKDIKIFMHNSKDKVLVQNIN